MLLMISQFTCHSHLIGVLPLSAHELDFLERLNSAGDIVPDLLTEDAAMQGIIGDHPGLRWKALGVNRRLGVVASDAEPNE